MPPKRAEGQSRIAGIAGRLQGCLGPVYGLMMGGILLVCVLFFRIRFGKSEYCEHFLPPVVLLTFGIVFFTGLYVLCGRLEAAGKLGSRRLFWWLSLFLLAVQIFAVYNYYFYTDWDVPNLLRLSDAVVHGKDIAEVPGIGYFSRYPNNLLLACVMTVIRKAAHIVGLHAHEYFAILCVQCGLNTLTGLLLAQTLDRLFGSRKFSLFGYVLYVLLVGMSPWVSIPYSDSMGLIFPMLMVYIYVGRARAKRAWLSWFGISVCAVIGYKLKPQTFIVCIAIVIIGLLELPRKGRTRDFTKKLSAVAAGVLCAGLVSQAAIASLHVPVNESMVFQLPHFLMMGMNPEDMGVWSEQDVKFSGSFAGAEERKQANMDLAMERIREMGPAGLLKHLVRKTLTNYGDGTFCWSGEGYFFRAVLEERGNPLCGFFRGLYYTREYAEVGKYYALWSNSVQMLWLTLLLFNVFAGLARRSSDQDVVMLAIIGLTLFEWIFEARARYLYTYAPLYILCAMYGFQALKEKDAARRRDGFGMQTPS